MCLFARSETFRRITTLAALIAIFVFSARPSQAHPQTTWADTAPPIDVAASQGKLDVVTSLLAGGADVNAKDSGDDTPLMFAAGNAHTDIVKLLLAHGADVNARDKKGWTALLQAAVGGNPEVNTLLLDAKSDINAKDN